MDLIHLLFCKVFRSNAATNPENTRRGIHTSVKFNVFFTASKKAWFSKTVR